VDPYVHNLDPVLLQIAGPFAVRWYGLAYLAGFLGGYFLWKRLSREGLFQVPVADLQNFVVLFAVLGVFLGGRLGYMLFYGWQDLARDPLSLFRVWEGGMSSHGGMIGVILFAWWYARKHRHSFLNLTDNLATVVPIGLLFGRLANFINGELWGRITTVPWAVIFPAEAGYQAPARLDSETVQALLAQGLLHPRHPSQLYEAFAEGLLLLAVLWWLRHLPWSRREGRLSLAFLALYAVARIAAECFREPDSTVYFGWLTKGQLLSALMLVGAAALLVHRKLWRRSA